MTTTLEGDGKRKLSGPGEIVLGLQGITLQTALCDWALPHPRVATRIALMRRSDTKLGHTH